MIVSTALARDVSVGPFRVNLASEILICGGYQSPFPHASPWISIYLPIHVSTHLYFYLLKHTS